MKKITLSALALVVMTASAFTLHSSQSAHSGELATNAPYRDGLYLGKLAVENGNQYRIATARWARAEDRAAFAAGYRQATSVAPDARSAELSQAAR